MADNEPLEMYRQHSAGQDKYTYFLLATAAAAIGFAVQKTEGLKFSYWLVPVGIAVVSWGISFFCGCRAINWVQACIRANFTLLQLRSGTHPEQPGDPAHVQIAINGVNKAFLFNLKKAQFYSVWQFRILLVGFLTFLFWRVLEMARLSCPA